MVLKVIFTHSLFTFPPNIYEAGAVTLSFQKHNLGLCMKGVAYESGGGGVGTQLSDPLVHRLALNPLSHTT